MPPRRRPPTGRKKPAPPQQLMKKPTSAGSESNESNPTGRDAGAFEDELMWCIHQLECETNPKKKAAAIKHVNTLASTSVPVVKKRALMRQLFGDYRKKMKSTPLQKHPLAKNFKVNQGKKAPAASRALRSAASKRANSSGDRVSSASGTDDQVAALQQHSQPLSGLFTTKHNAAATAQLPTASSHKPTELASSEAVNTFTFGFSTTDAADKNQIAPGLSSDSAALPAATMKGDGDPADVTRALNEFRFGFS